jgi:hypothetical protein
LRDLRLVHRPDPPTPHPNRARTAAARTR